MFQARSIPPRITTITEALLLIERLIETNYSITSKTVQTAINQLIAMLRKSEKDVLTTNELELRKTSPLTYENIEAMRASALHQEVRKAGIYSFKKIEEAILTRFEQLHPARKAALEALQARDEYRKSSPSDAKAAVVPIPKLSADIESQQALEKEGYDVALIEDEEVDLIPPPTPIGSFWTPVRKKAVVIVVGGIAVSALANELILTACDLANGANVLQRFTNSAAYGEDFLAAYGKTIPDFMKNSPTEIPNFSYFLIGAALLAIVIVTYKLHNNQLQAKKIVEEAEEAEHSLYGNGCYYLD